MIKKKKKEENRLSDHRTEIQQDKVITRTLFPPGHRYQGNTIYNGG